MRTCSPSSRSRRPSIRLPDPAKVAQWAAETPYSFTFSLKVPEKVTRSPEGPATIEHLRAFLARLAPLREAKKLGTLVAQFPATFRRERRASSLRAVIEALPAGERWAVELRHSSWWHADTYRLLSDAGVTLVWFVVEVGRTPPVVTRDLPPLRIFGDHALETPYDRRRRDGKEELMYWADRIHDEGASAERADALVNKYLEGYAPGSAATLMELLGQEAPQIGPRAGRKVARQAKIEG